MTEGSRRLTKNEKRRLKSKHQIIEVSNGVEKHSNGKISKGKSKEGDKYAQTMSFLGLNGGVDIEYVSAEYSATGNDAVLLDQFRTVFQRFSKPEELLTVSVKGSSDETSAELKEESGKQLELANNNAQAKGPLSKKKKKLLSRMSIAELKRSVPRPEVVEAHDITSGDPLLLVYLKSQRNTVPVPRHWCQIRKYLQGKRGVEKQPFQLPEFIAETGIAKIRESVMEQEALKKGKQKARERVKPKMGKIDIDYQVLHDAFFKYQTKPKLTGHGELYYEGKEFEINLKEKKPGVLSAELKAALGIQENVVTPPPWLINMQRYGLPPSYPNLRIPGLNAPLPPGATYGYHPGGWGKPPVDEYGRPLYGDVFGTAVDDSLGLAEAAQAIDKKKRFGALEEQDEEEPEEEEDEGEQGDDGKSAAGDKKAAGSKWGGRFDPSGAETPSTLDGIQSVTSGLDTPDTIDLRKRTGLDTPESSYSGGAGRELYTVIQEKHAAGAQAGQVFGSDRTYVLPGKGDVQLSLNPDELEEMLRDKDKLKDAHDALLAQQQQSNARNAGGNYADGMETEEDKMKGNKKRKMESSAATKRIKDFKF